MGLTRSEFDLIVSKLSLVIRSTDHVHAWLVYGGKIVVRTKRSHHKGGDLPCSDKIRQQLKVNEDQLKGLISCTFGYADYIEHLKSRGII